MQNPLRNFIAMLTMRANPYDDWAEIYDSVYSYVRSDIPFYVEQALASGGAVLELGVGTGRVALRVAAHGVDVVGLDSSDAMLAVARRNLDAANLAGSVELVSGDMRDFDLRGADGERRQFSLVAIPFRGFLALMSVEDQTRALERVRLHLRPDGRLAFSVFVPDPNMAFEQSDAPRHLADVSDPRTGAEYVLYQQTSYDFHNQVVSVRMMIDELDAARAVRRRLYRDYRLRYAHRWEIHHLLTACGFEVEALYGDFDMSEFDEYSTEMIWVARLAGG